MNRPEDDKADGGFLTRWARRKQEMRRQEEASPPAAPAALQPAEGQDLEPKEPETAEAPPLPSLDDIVPGSDVTAFFGKHVPESLRQAALRKLWITDPEIKGFIEMAENQWDFNNPDSIPGWSSKLTGVDVKAMAERLFSAAERIQKDEAAVPEAAETAPEAIRENTDLEAIPESSGGSESIGGTPAARDVAVQNNSSITDVYDTPRKRHGGALPT